jgi:cytochrome oxidase Cu insertion factor (SCO1/SenC/PrrC family)
MNAPDPKAVSRGRRQLVLLAALFFVPLAIAFWMYYGPAGWRPAGDASKGDLIEPARPLAEIALATADGKLTDARFLRGKWSMVYVGDGLCDDRCREALYLTRQSRIALNKDMDRVQRVFLVTGRCCDRGFLAQEHPDLIVARVDDDASAALLEPFPTYGSVPLADAGRIYLVDPLGNLLMSYAPTAPDKALLTDVKKLLRLSHIG